MASDRRVRLNRQPDASSWPRGVECVLIVNNEYVLNDRRRPDSIFVMNITGLTGADVVVAAEKNPDRDGETPQDGSYGGRTISLRGFVRGGDLEGMRYLYSYLMDAFDDLVERQLWFRWLDWRDTFEDLYALGDYSFDSGAGTLVVASDGSGLQPTSTAVKSIVLAPHGQDGSVPSRLTYGDGEAIIAFRPATSYSGFEAGIECRRSGPNNKLRVSYDGTNVNFTRIIAGSFFVRSTSIYTSAPGNVRYIRVRIEGSLVTMSLWDGYPPDIGGTSLGQASYTLTPTELIALPASSSGLSWGLYLDPNSVDDRVELLDVGAINKGDGTVYCRKASVIDGEEVQTDAGWRRDFMVTLRASDSRIVSRKVSTISIVPSGFALMFPRIWSFEGTDVEYFAGWTNNSFSTVFAPQTSVHATDGAYGLRCIGTVTSNDCSAFSPAFDVLPGQAWSARCDIYVNSAANDPANAGRIRIQWDDGSSTFGLGFTEGADISSGGGAKTATIANAIAPTGATQARLRILGSTIGSSTIDWLIDWVAEAQSSAVPAPAHGEDALFFPVDGSGLIFGAYLPQPVVNLGTRGAAAMIVRFYGPISNPVLLDPTTGRSLGLNFTVADGDYVEVNTFRRTAFDSDGNSAYRYLTDETSWPEIEGSVRFILGADSVSGVGRIEVSYRHSSR